MAFVRALSAPVFLSVWQYIYTHSPSLPTWRVALSLRLLCLWLRCNIVDGVSGTQSLLSAGRCQSRTLSSTGICPLPRVDPALFWTLLQLTLLCSSIICLLWSCAQLRLDEFEKLCHCCSFFPDSYPDCWQQSHFQRSLRLNKWITFDWGTLLRAACLLVHLFQLFPCFHSS